MTPEEYRAKEAADKKVEAQIAADQVAKAAHVNAEAVVIVGAGGSAFNINGVGFGGSGLLTIGGRPIPTTSWTDTKIRGALPYGVKGAVVLTTSSGVRHGVFPHVPPVVTKTTTTTVETK
jgi:hypothetical protein